MGALNAGTAADTSRVEVPPARGVHAIPRRAWPSIWAIAWSVLGALYFFLPLLATLQFSLSTGPGEYGLKWYTAVLSDAEFRSGFLLSLRLAAETSVIVVTLLVWTIYLAHLKLPRLIPILEFLSVLPFVVPSVALVAGLGFLRSTRWLLAQPEVLALIYVILALPYAYRSIDAGVRAIDIRTLSEAAQSLGASSARTLFLVILPNLRTAALGAAFLTIAIVMGEFVVSSLLLFNTFAVYINYVGQVKAYEAAALAVVSFAVTWAAMLGLSITSTKRRPTALDSGPGSDAGGLR